MNFSKTLAKDLSNKKIKNLDTFFDVVEKYNLSSVFPILNNKIKNISENKSFYDICNIVSSKDLSDADIKNIKQKYNIPDEVDTKIKVDKNILSSCVVYYQGKKWDDSAFGKLNRFNQM